MYGEPFRVRKVEIETLVVEAGAIKKSVHEGVISFVAKNTCVGMNVWVVMFEMFTELKGTSTQFQDLVR